MKNRKFFPVILLLGLMLSSAVNATGPRVTPGMLVVPENEIFAVDAQPFVGTDLMNEGMNVEIVKAALTSVEINSTLTILPVAKMVKYYLLQEQVLAAHGQYINLSKKDKKSLIFVPISLTKENYFYYHPAHKSGFNWQGKLSDLSGYSYGSYQEEDVAPYKTAGIQIVPGRLHALLRKLISNEIDFIRMPVLTKNWMLDKHFPLEKENIIAITTEAEWVPQFVIFNKNHPDGEVLARKLAQGLAITIGSGQYATILKKYLVDDEVSERIKRLNDLIQP